MRLVTMHTSLSLEHFETMRLFAALNRQLVSKTSVKRYNFVVIPTCVVRKYFGVISANWLMSA